MKVVRKFDPWNNELCTCPEKYSLNPYTGCGHRCIYCYATYIPNFYSPRRKKNLIERLRKDLDSIPPNSIISISNSSDPYTPMDKEYRDTRKCIQTLSEYDFSVLIVTKGDLVLRDIDLLQNLTSAVTITITTLKEKISQKLEPNAPPPNTRFEVLKKLSDNNVSNGLRFDPIFPELNEVEIEEVIRKASEVGASYVVSSTFKPQIDSWKRYKAAFPNTAEATESMYFEEGEKLGNSLYLSTDLRRDILNEVKQECFKHGLNFATCREGLGIGNSPSCDGSHLCS